jgi:hypothetical protein
MNTSQNKVNRLPLLSLVKWLAVALVLSFVVLLVYYFPWIVGLCFVLSLIVWSVLHLKQKGFWSTTRVFFKDMIWGLGD